METCECSICDNIFDAARHRPRALPCGHGFCTQCIEKCIRRGNKSCPICKKEYSANSAIDLPVCFLLEELLHKAAVSESHKQNSDSVTEEDSIGMCPNHKGISLYFLCTTHNMKVCHSCAVIDHPPSSCNLISLDTEIEKKKQSQILTVRKQKKLLKNTEADLKMLYQRNIYYLTEQEKEVEFLLNKIKQINQEIIKKKKSQEQINYSILTCQKQQESFEKVENRLKAAASNQDIIKESEMAITEVLKSQKWEETLRKELYVRKHIHGDYAQVERNGILRSCQVITEGGRTLIPTLCKEVTPPSSAELIKLEAELYLNFATTTMWMDLSARGQSLGRVYISVMGDRPQGRQFIMLAIGIQGQSLKGAPFSKKCSNYIELCDYVTESGTHSDKPLVTTKKWDNSETLSRGRIFLADKETAAFRIMIKDRSSTFPGYFGEVITGLEVIDRAASDEYYIAEIIISECGIVLDY
ncbi:unnamed protein product [Meganyctiphanes norvegica]|uniref:RING-type domain-containing protein n=1 Tax=Meganyctiphanes norvegica TaxID=48144 RepID=A0AAV2RL54_MEGNR